MVSNGYYVVGSLFWRSRVVIETIRASHGCLIQKEFKQTDI